MNIESPVKIRSFTDLNAWKEGHKLVLSIYRATDNFPKKETYSLIDQMRRSASSITSNIAEGFGRQTYKEKIRFYYIAQGSLTELKNQLLIARDVLYLEEKKFMEIADLANIVHQLLKGLIRKSSTFINHNS
jgi:four helix bundle protein